MLKEMQGLMFLLCGFVICWSVALGKSDRHQTKLSDNKLDNTSNSTPQFSAEKRLVKHLLRQYRRVGRIGRPVRNASTPVVVDFGLGLIKMDVIEKDNMLTVSVWTRYEWTDEYLMWDPAQYGGVASVKLPTDMIWMPDIMLYNTASTEKFEREVLTVVKHDGTVTWYPHRIFYSSCSIDVRNFPFDNQTCHMAFGSWTHTEEEIDLRLTFGGGIDLSTFKADFKETSKWDVEEVKATRLPGSQSSGFAVLTFTLALRRRLIFSSYILTFPVVFLSFLTLLVFWLPAESADKSSLGLTIFGSLLLLLLILVEASPPTAAAVPLLGLYYCFNIVIVMLSIFLSTIVCKIGEVKDGRHPLPACLKRFLFKYLAAVLCLKIPKLCTDKEKELLKLNDKMAPKINRFDTNTVTGSPAWEAETSSNPDTLGALESLVSSQSTDGTTGIQGGADVNALLWRHLVNTLSNKHEEEQPSDAKKLIDVEWKFAAAILDRIFLIIYIIVIIVSLFIMFPR